MVIISENKASRYSGYSKTQFRYGMTYVVITFVVLLILNIYCSQTCQELFYESKKTSMVEKCLLASDEIGKLEVLNPTTVAQAVSQMESLKVTRLIVTDTSGSALFDSAGEAAGTYVLFPEILTAMEGNDVCSWKYHDGTVDTRAAAPIDYSGTMVGCVYITEYDTVQGGLIQSMQRTVLRISLLLEAVVILFTILFSFTFSRRLNRIMTSMRIIQEGDYTHKVNMGGNDELTILGNEFNDLTERLKNSEEKRSRFVSDASHELKTPLASIKLLADSILQYDMDLETVREFVGDIGDEAERLNRMTAKLLSLTRAEDAASQESEIIYMAPTVRRVARMLKQNALQSKVSFQLDLDSDTPILILEDDLYQIVFNLMENGIKYNQPGGILSVRLYREEDNAVLQVSDTGAGIPEDALSHIFERFYRVDKARSRATGGSGLGLSIVRTIVQRNRGEIQVYSVLGQGSTFTVTFPAFDAEVDKT
ncbi:MAG TPA: HAMP domain-containing protein [Candidatus Faecousia intestinavium]|uniref:histidine kinase n=1 Tax=Candidatus Faecousia excrementigallinarum TaxID=2840806 RepID=A0A9D0Z351_9FIRM|nr:HAMP domain-containing protein [Candidatus Faecousia excrementigallinarum]HIT35393.1 HAMP domain-containing protein [Candidatus Faecousia intestinavium]